MTDRRKDRLLARGDRSEAVRHFNYLQMSKTAREPTAMELALAEAARTPETKRPPGRAVAEGGGEAALPESNPNTTADGWRHAHAEVLAALQALYGGAK